MSTGDKVTAPPVPSTPKGAPWGDQQEIIRLLQLLVDQGGGEPGSPAARAATAVKGPEAFTVPTPATALPIPEGLSQTELLELLVGSAQSTALFAFGREARWLSFDDSIAALESAKEEQTVPFDGVIPSLIVQFPDGLVTSAGKTLVDVRLLYESDFVVPGMDNQWLSFNNFLLVFPVNQAVASGKKLFLERKNYDSTYDHTVTAFVLVLSQEQA